MKKGFLAIGGASVACAILTAAMAATPAFVTSARVIEATSGSVVLPSGASSTLVVTPCGGCPPRSIAATAATTYYLDGQQISLDQLRAALAGKPNVYLSLFQSTRTGELMRIVAALDPSQKK